MPAIISKVVGVQFSDYKKSTNYVPGQSIELVWDRTNPYDKLAVQVFVRDGTAVPTSTRIGFLPKGTDAQVIAVTHEITDAVLEEYWPEKATHEMFKIKLNYLDLPEKVALV